MAYKIIETTDSKISLQEFVDHVNNNVDFSDEGSILAASVELKKLSNNRTFITSLINEELKNQGLQKNNQYAGQSLILHSTPSFLVRAVTWLPESKNHVRKTLERDLDFYGIAHDHAFNLMTVGYHGKGYETDFYEYDRKKVVGYVGENVDLAFLEHTNLGLGEILFMRESKDIHIQYPPAELSISLNLMSKPHNGDQNLEQFLFDVEKKVIVGFPTYGVSNRTALIEMAGLIADENTIDLLWHLAKDHRDPRTRRSALSSLNAYCPDESREAALIDPHPLVNESYLQG